MPHPSASVSSRYRTRALLGALCCAALLAGCQPEEPTSPNWPKEAEGYAPIYDTDGAASRIGSGPARKTEAGGNIYVKGNVMYQVERGQGIHIIDISQPSSPQKTGFIEVRGCQELSVQGNLLYTNNINDLVILDISQPGQATEVRRLASAFRVVDPNRPPEDTYFECPDPAKGAIIGWERRTLKNPKCR